MNKIVVPGYNDSMKKVNKYIEVIAMFDKNGIRPLRWRILENDQLTVIKVDASQLIENDGNVSINNRIAFRCVSHFDNGQKREYVLQLNICKMKWSLWEY